MQTSSALIPNAEVFSGDLPDLQQATPAPLELSSEYWSPSIEGESRRMFFDCLRTEQSINDRGEDIELLVAYFVEPLPGGKRRMVRQASRRLIAVFENFAQTIKPGMAFEIVYKGKKRNKTNSYLSDDWSVTPLSTKY